MQDGISLDAVIAQAPGPLRVMAKDLGTGAIVRRGADQPIPAASTIKVPILGTVAAAVFRGQLAWDALHTMSEKELGVPGSGVLRRFRWPVCMSLYNLATLMIIVSDNAATNYLIGLVGFDAVNEFCRDQGLVQTQCVRLMRSGGAKAGEADNMTTVEDQVTLYERLHRGTVLSPQVSREMLEILAGQQVATKMPRYLNWVPGIRFAHKTGTTTGNGASALDAGLIFLGDAPPIVLSVACTGWRHQAYADEAIGQVAYSLVGAWRNFPRDN